MTHKAAFLRDLTDAGGYLDTPEDMAPYLKEWRGAYTSHALAVLRPRSTEEVAAIVKAATQVGLAIVPQGGNTGLVGGSVVEKARPGIIINLSRMNAIRALDPLDYTMTVEAGCILKTLQEAADSVDRYLPLSLGAEGSCEIGGTLSTNAGGILTLRHGNARSLVLGLEIVLPDGQIWHGLKCLRKDNTGYDLKQIFIGAEGTLGIITAAVLKLSSKPRSRGTAFIAVHDPQAAVSLLALLREASGDSVEAFEIMARLGLDYIFANMANTKDPLARSYDWYVVAELTSGFNDAMRSALEAALAQATEQGLILDAAIAETETQSHAFWRLREAIVEAQHFTGGFIPHDVAVPVSQIPGFIEAIMAEGQKLLPGLRAMPFGHIGDGNLHFTLVRPEGLSSDDFMAQRARLTQLVYDITLSYNGSISAEHGIGLAKKAELQHSKSSVDLALMRQLKTAFDPAGLMNPGKII